MLTEYNIDIEYGNSSVMEFEFASKIACAC